jgi:phospholipid/cholesterol/gamma-HCH transport system ATP-binding protein
MNSAGTPPKIALTDINKSFGSKHVLKDLNLTVENGESLVVIGGSGSGKSVMLKCILGLLSPDNGAVKIDGQETMHISMAKRKELMTRFGMLFQSGALFDSLSVWENIAFRPIQHNGMGEEEAHELAMDKLAAVGLERRVADLYPAELSGGMQKRVALARAIATNPEVILFDEPTTGLDPIMSDVINYVIIDCKTELGATTISITHDIASARKIADSVAMIYDGQIIWHGSVDEMDDCDNDYVQQFINGRAEGPIQMQAKHKRDNGTPEIG